MSGLSPLGMPGFRTPPTSGPEVAWLDYGEDGATASTYTISALDFGAAQADRYIVAAIHGRSLDARTISSVTIGGNAAAVVTDGTTTAFIDDSDGSTNTETALYIFNLTTGTSGDVVVNWGGGTLLRCAVATFRMVGISGAQADEVFTDSLTSPLTATLDLPANANLIAAATEATGSGSSSSWSNITERYDEHFESTSVATGACDNYPAGGSTSPDVSVQSPLDETAVFASWAPA